MRARKQHMFRQIALGFAAVLIVLMLLNEGLQAMRSSAWDADAARQTAAQYRVDIRVTLMVCRIFTASAMSMRLSGWPMPMPKMISRPCNRFCPFIAASWRAILALTGWQLIFWSIGSMCAPMSKPISPPPCHRPYAPICKPMPMA